MVANDQQIKADYLVRRVEEIEETNRNLRKARLLQQATDNYQTTSRIQAYQSNDAIADASASDFDSVGSFECDEDSYAEDEKEDGVKETKDRHDHVVIAPPSRDLQAKTKLFEKEDVVSDPDNVQMLMHIVQACKKSVQQLKANADLKERKLQIENIYLRKALSDAQAEKNTLNVHQVNLEKQISLLGGLDNDTSHLRQRELTVERHLNSLLVARNQAVEENHKLKRLLLHCCHDCRSKVSIRRRADTAPLTPVTLRPKPVVPKPAEPEFPFIVGPAPPKREPPPSTASPVKSCLKSSSMHVRTLYKTSKHQSGALRASSSHGTASSPMPSRRSLAANTKAGSHLASPCPASGDSFPFISPGPKKRPSPVTTSIPFPFDKQGQKEQVSVTNDSNELPTTESLVMNHITGNSGRPGARAVPRIPFPDSSHARNIRVPTSSESPTKQVPVSKELSKTPESNGGRKSSNGSRSNDGLKNLSPQKRLEGTGSSHSSNRRPHRMFGSTKPKANDPPASLDKVSSHKRRTLFGRKKEERIEI